MAGIVVFTFDVTVSAGSTVGKLSGMSGRLMMERRRPPLPRVAIPLPLLKQQIFRSELAVRR